MPTSTIRTTEGSSDVTLVNVFTVPAERQLDLARSLDRATGRIFTGLEGFVSANLHVSLDGERVINYAQWSSTEAYRAAMSRPDVQEHIAEAASLATSFDPTLVTVFAIHAAGGASAEDGAAAR